MQRVLVVIELRFSLYRLLQRLIRLQTGLRVLLLEVVILLRLMGLSLLLDHLMGPATAAVISIRPAHGEVGLMLLVILRFEAPVLLVQMLVMNDDHGSLARLLFCVIVFVNYIRKLASMRVDCTTYIVLLGVARRN